MPKANDGNQPRTPTQADVKMSLEMAKSLFPRRAPLAGSTYIRASLCPWRSCRLRMRATSSGGFGSARGILERCCRPWPFWPRGTSNTTETEARAALGSPYIGSHQLLHYSRWPMANCMVPIVVLRRRNPPLDVENVSVIRWQCRRTGVPNCFSKWFLQILQNTLEL